MTIHTTIIIKMADYEVKTGIKPNAIYFGEDECDLLKGWLCAIRVSKIFIDAGYYNAKVYEVKKKNHLSVGFINGQS